MIVSDSLNNKLINTKCKACAQIICKHSYSFPVSSLKIMYVKVH